ncbi:hypothetical protein U14_01243 [Candidatus Moduliflexus flocculans]|uniref:Uncharacterized protein n=1 Tax=Candidatus Moduliflexus flocculans TaxID=1499966 RepID=A0A0S6VRY8_9BACT|nr:hypothetical protein U14_01243 [Candidatus Moduliflexus flocculans]
MDDARKKVKKFGVFDAENKISMIFLAFLLLLVLDVCNPIFTQ